MSFTIQPATRTAVKPLVGMYGKSGAGKTMSALLLARGLVGPAGRIVLIDSENKRGSLFADVIPGGYSVLDIDSPFSPDRYSEAFDVAEKESDCIVIDSLTHEHNGEGGVLDMQEAELNRMAGDDWKKREACKMASWIKPKIAHKKFIQRILRSRTALICCLRGEEKTHMQKGHENEKTKVITDEFSTPIFDPRFLFELLVNFEVVAVNGEGGYTIPRKVTHPAIAALLPKRDDQMSIRHGEAIAAWAKGGTVEATKDRVGSSPEVKALKKQLFAATKGEHGGDSEKFWEFLYTKKAIDRMEYESLEMPEKRWIEAIEFVEGLA